MLTSKYKITMREIYAILQNHFRSVTIPRTQQSPLAGTHGIGVDDLTSVDLTRALHDLRDEIRAKDKQICNYQQIIHEAERSVRGLTLIIREKDQDILESHEKLSQAEHAIIEMMEQQLELNIRREREISELTIAIEGLEQEIAKQKANIVVLESQLERPFIASDHRLLKKINIPPNWTVACEALIRLSDIDRNRSSRESDKQGDKTTVYMWFWISHCQYVTRTSCPRHRWIKSQSRCLFIRQEQARNIQWSNPANQFVKSINAQNPTKF
jgi:hypothetical protein